MRLSRSFIQCIEFIQNPGETVFVPGGWWHAVVNLDNTMAVTQNVMTKINFDTVWKHLRKERKKLASKFLKNLKIKDAKLYDRAIELNKADNWLMHDEDKEKKLLGKRKFVASNSLDENEKIEKKIKRITSTTSSSASSSSSSSESDSDTASQ